jgi:hypothetical protein
MRIETLRGDGYRWAGREKIDLSAKPVSLKNQANYLMGLYARLRFFGRMQFLDLTAEAWTRCSANDGGMTP